MAEQEKIAVIEPQPQQSGSELEVVKPENRNDPRYFYLTKPLLVDGREINHLLVDPETGNLSGREFFATLATYQRKYPEDSRTTFNPYMSPLFLSLVIAKLNKITPEDLYKAHWKDLPKLFLQAASFQFSVEPTNTTES